MTFARFGTKNIYVFIFTNIIDGSSLRFICHVQVFHELINKFQLQ